MSIPWVNKVMLVGKVVQKPQLRKIPGNYVLAEFILNVTREIRGKNGDKMRESTLVSIISWGVTAQNVAKYLDEGRIIHVEGRLQYHEWLDKATGKKRTKHDIVAQNVIYLDKAPVRKAGTTSEVSGTASPTIEVAKVPLPSSKSRVGNDVVTADHDILSPMISSADDYDPDRDEQWYEKTPEHDEDLDEDSSWDVDPTSRRRSYDGYEDDDEENIRDGLEDDLQNNYRDEEPLYRDGINHDEWKDLTSEYDDLSKDRHRQDLSQEDLDELESRLDELRHEINTMHDINVVARRLPSSR